MKLFSFSLFSSWSRQLKSDRSMASVWWQSSVKHFATRLEILLGTIVDMPITDCVEYKLRITASSHSHVWSVRNSAANPRRSWRYSHLWPPIGSLIDPLVLWGLSTQSNTDIALYACRYGELLGNIAWSVHWGCIEFVLFLIDGKEQYYLPPNLTN